MITLNLSFFNITIICLFMMKFIFILMKLNTNDNLYTYVIVYIFMDGLLNAVNNFVKGVAASMGLHNFFWKIFCVSFSSTAFLMFYFIVKRDLGIWGFLMSMCFKYILETIFVLFIIIKKGNEKIFFIPSFNEIKYDFMSTFWFTFNYAFSYYFENIGYEIISLVLLYCTESKKEILIWVIIIQIIQIFYGLGYSIGSYSRVLANYYIGKNEPENVSIIFKKSILFNIAITFSFSLTLFILADWFAFSFIYETQYVIYCSKIIRYIAFVLPFDSCRILLNSYLRLLNHKKLSSFLNFMFIFMILFLGSIYLSVYKNLGCKGVILSMVASQLLFFSTALFRVLLNIDYYSNEKAKYIKELNYEDKNSTQFHERLN